MVQGVEHILVGQDQLFPVFLDVPQGLQILGSPQLLWFINSTPELKYSVIRHVQPVFKPTWVSGLMELAAAK